MVATVNQCCCGCSLKTGTIIIGVLYTLGAIGGLATSIMSAKLQEITPAQAQEAHITEEAREWFNYVLKAQSYIGIVMAIIYVIELIVSIMLLFGAGNENPKLIKPWIMYAIVQLVVMVVIYFILIIIFFVYSATTMAISYLVGIAVGALLAAYFIIVVNSYHRELLGQRNPSKI